MLPSTLDAYKAFIFPNIPLVWNLIMVCIGKSYLQKTS